MCVLSTLVGLKGQFSDPIKDLLLCYGSRRVACFCHGCLCLGGFHDLLGQSGAVANRDDNN